MEAPGAVLLVNTIFEGRNSRRSGQGQVTKCFINRWVNERIVRPRKRRGGDIRFKGPLRGGESEGAYLNQVVRAEKED